MKKFIAAATLALLLLPGMAFAQFLSVKGPKANFRQGPSVNEKIAYTADKYYPVKILKKDKGWVQVEDFEGEKAWVLEKLLSKQKSVVVKREKANIRQKASTKAKIIFNRLPGRGLQGDQGHRQVGPGPACRRRPGLDPSLPRLGDLILRPLGIFSVR